MIVQCYFPRISCRSVQATCDHIKMIEEGQPAGTMDEFNNYIQPNSFVVVLKNLPRMTELEHVPGVSRVEAINSKSVRVWFDTDDDVTARMVRRVSAGDGS